jgi:hypothetical protein
MKCRFTDGDGDDGAAAGDAEEAINSAIAGKVGLGLSGGGFRAALFHIGVLAQLAERDVLRSVEVLSCVSGGSIVGAHYYLEARKLLQTKPDGEITREDYIDIVQRLERDFLAGVQRNIRTRIIAELWTNLKLIILPTYTRTSRAGELYERELYMRVDDAAPGQKRDGEEAGWPARLRAWFKDGEQPKSDTDETGWPARLKGWLKHLSRLAARVTGRDTKPRWLTDLYIRPAGEVGEFNPKYHNWRRRAKVPMLVINATTLNTGHNWQFTASWMGEPPIGINTEIDASDHLRRMYYDEAPPAHRNIRLGHAVAASSCVPGLFEPLVLKQLYPERTVRLVDGGAQDNQGISSLLEQDCNLLLVSDASGQMESIKDPKESVIGRLLGGAVGVLLRTQDILMARVREAQYDDLMARRRSALLRGVMYIHLTKDLDNDPIDWIGCDDPHYASEEALPVSRRGPHTRYGFRKEVQRLLASIRTDLDSFTDVEAYALMASGYRMTEYEFPKQIRALGACGAHGPEPNWRFLAIRDRMRIAGENKPYKLLVKQLRVSSSIALKAWRLSRFLQIVAGLLGLSALGGLVYAISLYVMGRSPEWFNKWFENPLVELNPSPREVVVYAATMLGTMIGGLALGSWIANLIRYKKTLTRALIHAGMGLAGWLLARIHVHIFDRLYLRVGSLHLKPDAFLCYVHRADSKVARADEWLRARGCRNVVDGKDTLFSPLREKAIKRLIKDSKAFVYFSSGGDSNPPGVTQDLYAFARRKGKRIAYVNIAGTNDEDHHRRGGDASRYTSIRLRFDEQGRPDADDMEQLWRFIMNKPEPQGDGPRKVQRPPADAAPPPAPPTTVSSNGGPQHEGPNGNDPRESVVRVDRAEEVVGVKEVFSPEETEVSRRD